MWYLNYRQFNPELYNERIDELLKIDRMGLANPPLSWTVDKGMFEARNHGTVSTDAGTVCWHDKTAQKRAETEMYGLYGQELADYFALVPAAVTAHDSFYIIDMDDPELVEHGELHFSTRLTSHLGDPVSQPPETWLPNMAAGYEYSLNIALDSLQVGVLPPAAIYEILRQRLGYPYEWLGAEVE